MYAARYCQKEDFSCSSCICTVIVVLCCGSCLCNVITVVVVLCCSGSIDCVCYVDDSHFFSGADDGYC